MLSGPLKCIRDGRNECGLGLLVGSGFHNLAAMDALDIVIVGGCGHVGLPLALSFADAGYRVGVDDTDAAKIERVRSGEVPFKEAGAEQLLRKLLSTGRLEFGWTFYSATNDVREWLAMALS